MARLLIAGLASVILAAGCGGGGGGGSGDDGIDPADIAPGTSPEGRWAGTTSNGRSIGGVVLDDGSYWLPYSLVGNDQVIGGLLQGTGSSQLGNFTSSNAMDFNLDGLGNEAVNISANYLNKKRFAGKWQYVSNSVEVEFTTTYDAAYDLTPTLAAIAGSYTGAAATFGSGVFSGGASKAATLTVTAAVGNSADVSGSNPDCSYTGTVTPHARGNVYDLSLVFSGSGCDLDDGSTVTGVALFDAATKRLQTAGLNAGRTDGFIFVGNKP